MRHTENKQIHKVKPQSAGMAQPGFWLAETGDIIRVDCHVGYVLRNPESFGYARDDLQTIYIRHGEKLGSNGHAREEILQACIARGWIRVRRYKTYWAVNARALGVEARNRIAVFFLALTDITGASPFKEEDVSIDVHITDSSGENLFSSTVRDLADGMLMKGSKGDTTADTLVSESENSGEVKPTWEEIRRKYPDIQRCFDALAAAADGKISNLSGARDFFIAMLKENDITPYYFLSHVVEMFMRECMQQQGRAMIYRMTAEMFLALNQEQRS